MVRLLLIKQIETREDVYGFNPTMVRLLRA